MMLLFNISPLVTIIYNYQNDDNSLNEYKNIGLRESSAALNRARCIDQTQSTSMQLYSTI